MPRRKNHTPDVTGNMWNETTPAPTVAVKAAVAVALPEAVIAAPRKRRGPRPGEGGRPRRAFTTKEIARIGALAEVGATRLEIAGTLGMSVDTFNRRLRDSSAVKNAFFGGRARARVELRRRQIQIALDDTDPGQARMLIFLGRVLLGQCPPPRADVRITTEAEAIAVFHRLGIPELAAAFQRP